MSEKPKLPPRILITVSSDSAWHSSFSPLQFLVPKCTFHPSLALLPYPIIMLKLNKTTYCVLCFPVSSSCSSLYLEYHLSEQYRVIIWGTGLAEVIGSLKQILQGHSFILFIYIFYLCLLIYTSTENCAFTYNKHLLHEVIRCLKSLVFGNSDQWCPSISVTSTDILY